MEHLIKIIKRFFNYWPAVVLVLVWSAVVAVNYRPHSFLSGWDNLHPEFNFNLNIKRSLFAVWQEYQGLGLLGGMGHASDLLRQIFLWAFSFIIPKSFLRYFYHFLMLLSGSVGVYFLLKNFILKNFENTRKIASLSGALFYLFNLATLQMFYVPFEAFSAHFGFLPWLFLTALNFWERKSRKNLLFFLLINVLSATQGYVATVFVVYILGLFLASIVYVLQNKKSLKTVILSYILIFLVNSFWLLPNLYFVAANVSTNLEAKINLMATEDIFLKNQKYGNLRNVALLKGFWFDNVEIDDAGIPNKQMGQWVDHFNSPIFTSIGYFLFGVSILGLVFSLIKKTKPSLIFLPVFALGFTFLANDTPGFSFLARLFYELPLFLQMFRFPFTKFSILTAFCLAIYFGVFVSYLLQSLKHKLTKWLAVVLLILPVIYLYPIFKGNLFYFKEKSRIPEEYFQVFNYFKSQDPNTRIANFPQPTYWGWTFYRWNYSGSGFLWYGIEQPILDRAFDVWSGNSENYFWEISYALYSKDLALFETIFEKYQINWLLVDENVISATGYKGLGLEELKELLDRSAKFVLVKSFGKVKIYKVSLKNPVINFIYLAQALPSVGPNYSWTNYDRVFGELGDYFSNQPLVISDQLPITSNQESTTDDRSPITIYYPFRSLFTGRNPDELDFEIKETVDSYIFTKQLPNEVAGYDLKLPEFDGKELLWLNPADFSDFKYLIPQVHRDGNSIEVVIPKVGGYFSAELNNDLVRLAASEGEGSERIFNLENLLHKYGYLIKVEAQNVEGNSLLFWLENMTAKRADMELYLPKDNGTHYLIQPPMSKAGLGYSLHFENVSVGRQKMVNDLGKVTIYPIPFNFLTGLKFVSSEVSKPTPLKVKNVSHPNPSVYEVELKEIPENSTLVLSQSFHKGWRAYDLGTRNNEPGTVKFLKTFLAPLLGKEIKDHVLVNNWQNGWQLDSMVHGSKFIVLIFWPQYLEYLGFILAGGGIPILIFSNLKKPYSNAVK